MIRPSDDHDIMPTVVALAGAPGEGSVADQITDRLRAMIVVGTLTLGEQLSENALAARLDTSRTPVREAFLRLAGEDLIVVRPQRGTFVFAIDAEGTRELCELRAILEIGALRLAVARDRSALAERLGSLAERSAAAIEEPRAYQPHDIAFHRALFDLAANRSLAAAYGRIAGRVAALRWRLTRTHDQVAQSQADHRRLIDAIATGRDEDAEATMRAHVSKSHRMMQAMFEGADRDAPPPVVSGGAPHEPVPEADRQEGLSA